MSKRILIVEDEELLRESLVEFFQQEKFTALSTETLEGARRELGRFDFDLIILDLKLPDGSGLELLAELQGADAPLVIVATAFPEVQTAVRALKLGAFDYINKPFDLDELQMVAERALETRRLRGEVSSFKQREKKRLQRSWSSMVGDSPELQQLRRQIMLVAASDSTTALILGESGVGKELVAESIHYQSSRNEEPLLKVNCAALPATLLENELFGHEKGAYTDAKSSRKGLFELAHRGTLFLDEIAEMDIGLQAKLLRVLEDRTITRIGGQRPVHIDVRIVTATNRDLPIRIAAGCFREDLYYRLNVFPLQVPPLREHADDIPSLAEQFLKEFLARSPGKEGTFSGAALRRLQNYSWPGNVRELRNLVERTVLLHPGGEIGEADFTLNNAGTVGEDKIRIESLADLEREHILKAYRHTGQNKSQTADLLGINRLTLRRKLKEYGVE